MPESRDMLDVLSSSLHEELHKRKLRIDAIFAETEQIDAWVQIANSPELRKVLEGRRGVLSGELLSILSEWRRLGGLVELRESYRPPRRIEEEPRREAPIEPPPRRPAFPPVFRDEAPPAPVPVHREEVEAASEDSVSRLNEHFKAGPAFRETPSVDWRGELQGILSGLALGAEDEAELDRVHRAIRDCDRWRVLPKDLQRNLVGLMASRLRRLQDERQLTSPQREDAVARSNSQFRIEDSFSRLSAYSKREQPGYVIGLSRHHRPMRDTWEEDAEAYWERLSTWAPEPEPAPSPNHERLLTELEGVTKELSGGLPPEVREAVVSQLRRTLRKVLEGGVSPRDPRLIRLILPFQEDLDGQDLRSLRRILRDAHIDSLSEEEEEKMETRTLLPDEWRWWGRTRGRRALIVGGEPREVSRVRLKEAFNLSELDWESADFRRNSLMGVRDRVRMGKVDLIIILGAFVGHDADDIIIPACRERGVDWVHVDKGYGVVRLRRAIERFLDPAPPEGLDA